MKLGQAFKMAFKSIIAKKGRSFLTMLGIIIGIASVMTIVSVVNCSNQKTMEYFESMGTNKVSVYGHLNSGDDFFETIYNYCKGFGDTVLGVTPNVYVYDVTIKAGTRTSVGMEYVPNVLLGSDQYAACNNFQIELGRDICALDVQKCNKVCVLGARAAKDFFDYASPVGQTISLKGIPYTVIGVYREKNPNPGGYSLDNVIVMPYTAARFLGASFSSDECVVKVKNASDISSVRARIQSYLDGLTRNGENGYGYAYSENEWMEASSEEVKMMSLVLGGIAGISLLVGGIGIMNIMLVTVTERTREIGIRRAIGAERGSIVSQFLVEAAMICGIGGIIGICIGTATTRIAGKLIMQVETFPSPSITLASFGFSVILGILFGMYPAVKASGLQPVVALRAN